VKIERRPLTKKELAGITSQRPVVGKIRRPETASFFTDKLCPEDLQDIEKRGCRDARV
jgi:hypothetical protein